MPQQLYELSASRYPAAANLTITITTNATYWGDMLGAGTVLKHPSIAGVAPQMFPEIVMTMPSLA